MTSASSKPSSRPRAKARNETAAALRDPAKGERIAKVMARAGVCSRRDAERWIADGRVAVDGKVLTTPATLVTDQSIITVDGKAIQDKEPTQIGRAHV